jgi:hypothetical protein
MTDNPDVIVQGDPDAWLADLSDELADTSLIIANPIIQRIPLAGIVVSSKRLFVLHIRNWQGHILPAKEGPFRGQSTDGVESSYTNPAPAVHEAEHALRSFLHDEFPKYKPHISHLVALVNPGADVGAQPDGMSFKVTRLGDLAQEIKTIDSGSTDPDLDQATRESVAVALQGSWISRNYRTLQPFVFRGDSRSVVNRRAWTVQQAFRHMNRFPKDGIYHLRNGTLEQWLTSQGALHLAQLTHEAVSVGDKDPRISLEKLLAKSGLVDPRGATVRPRRLDMGRVLTGAECGQLLTVQARARHGYVAGTLDTTARWLRVDPKQVTGHTCLVAVRADTSNLPIQDTPHEGTIVFTSQLLADSITIPVKVRVVGEPSRFSKFVLRPLLGFLIAAVIGFMLGVAMGQWGIAPPGWLSRFTAGWSPSLVWGVIFGIFWAAWGLIYGLQQPVTQPLERGLLRWLVVAMLWMLPLGLIALTVAWALAQVYSASNLARPEVGTSIVIVALALAIVPAVLDKSQQHPDNHIISANKARLKRPLTITIVSICLALLVFIGVMFVPKAWRIEGVQETKTSAQGWLATQYYALRDKIDNYIRDYYLRQYDRRAPLQQPPTPTRTAAPTRTP